MVNDALGNALAVGDRVAFMNLVAGDGYTSNSIGHGVISKFTPKMVGISNYAGAVIFRLPSKIVKVYNQG